MNKRKKYCDNLSLDHIVAHYLHGDVYATGNILLRGEKI